MRAWQLLVHIQGFRFALLLSLLLLSSGHFSDGLRTRALSRSAHRRSCEWERDGERSVGLF